MTTKGKYVSGPSVPRGFTFIELLYVAGIVGILFSIALPAYHDYLMRARVAEGLVHLGFAREAVSDFFSRWGYLPANNAQAGLLPAEEIKGVYLRRLEVRGGALQAQIELGYDAENKPIVGAVALRPLINTAQPSAPIVWFCGNGDPKKTYPEYTVIGEPANQSVTEKFLPGPCRAPR